MTTIEILGQIAPRVIAVCTPLLVGFLYFQRYLDRRQAAKNKANADITAAKTTDSAQ